MCLSPGRRGPVGKCACIVPLSRSNPKTSTIPLFHLQDPFNEGATTYLDQQVAPDTQYFYAGQSDQWWFRANTVRLPEQSLPQDLDDAWLLINKLNYCLGAQPRPVLEALSRKLWRQPARPQTVSGPGFHSRRAL